MMLHAIGRTGAAMTAAAVLMGAVGCTQVKEFLFGWEGTLQSLGPSKPQNVVDDRGRFREIYCAIRTDHGRTLAEDRECDDALVYLEDEPAGTGAEVTLGMARMPWRVMVIPGVIGECFQHIAAALPHARAHLSQHGYRTEVIPVSGRSGSSHNALQIRDYLVANTRSDEPVILVGYSKGAVDALEAVVNHPEVLERTAAVISLAGAVGGSQLADDTPALLESLSRHVDLPACDDGDGLAVKSLRTDERKAWLAEHSPLPEGPLYLAVPAMARKRDISFLLLDGYHKLRKIDPRNDSQVLFQDAVIPGGVLLGYANGDHWAVALPFSRDAKGLAKTLVTRNAYPREVLLEAITRYVEERVLADTPA